MKLSKLSNRQLRNLLRKGEVRFASEKDQEYAKTWKEIRKQMAEMRQTIWSKAWPIRYRIEALLKKVPDNDNKREILKRFKELKTAIDSFNDIMEDSERWWNHVLYGMYY